MTAQVTTQVTTTATALNILLACEHSGTFFKAFSDLGHQCTSVDLLPAAATHPDPARHHQMDIVDFLFPQDTAETFYPLPDFDLVIAFPPCTHLARSGAKHWPAKQANGVQQAAIDFFMFFATLTELPQARRRFPRVAIENSVGIMSTRWRKPDQVVHPYHFGDPFQKQTCWWITAVTGLSLPPLSPTASEPYDKGTFHTTKSGKILPTWYNLPPSADRGHKRSLAFPGMAAAAAKQWSKHIILEKLSGN